MPYMIAALLIIIFYLIINCKVTKTINSIFRHDLYNDLQLVDGYITLNKLDRSKQYLNAAYDKKEIYSVLDKSNLIVKFSYLLLYKKIHKRTSKFNIYLAENILENMFFSFSFVKTIFKVHSYINTFDISSSITIEIEKDCVEVISAKEVKNFPI